jgi:Na+/H+-dicarboxylate symporter
VLAAILLGGLLGHFYPQTGDAFIKLVKMIIAPVIFLTIVTGIAGMRDLGSLGRLAGKAFAYFLFFSTLALFVGMAIAGMALILGVARFMSECRSLTNFIGNAVATVVVSRWDGKLDAEHLHAALSDRSSLTAEI